MPGKQHPGDDADQIDQLTQLSILRILAPLGGHKLFITRSGFSSDVVARAAGMGTWLDDNDLDFDPKVVRNKLRRMHRLAEQGTDTVKTPATLRTNMVRLANLVGCIAAARHSHRGTHASTSISGGSSACNLPGKRVSSSSTPRFSVMLIVQTKFSVYWSKACLA